MTSRALVLGGGGVAGIAWEIGVLFGLAEAGLDVTDADRIIGTSAGAAVGAQITSGRPLSWFYERQVSGEAVATEIAADFDAEAMMSEWGRILTDTAPGPAMYRAIGSFAVDSETVAEPIRRAVIEARLPRHEWPEQDLRITAIDAVSGEPRVFTHEDDVPLVDAVAASCAVPGVWPPVTIDGTRYVDGGMRSTANVDLAAGCDDVLVIVPMAELPMVAPEVAAAADWLAEQSRVVTIRADDEALAAIGPNPLDPASAPAAAAAGRAQAARHVDEVAALWRKE